RGAGAGGRGGAAGAGGERAVGGGCGGVVLGGVFWVLVGCFVVVGFFVFIVFLFVVGLELFARGDGEALWELCGVCDGLVGLVRAWVGGELLLR
ncbi:hypothetical protein, partial [Pseudomonas syringae group genomosp. 7]|uniref:hypothetical protein n=1 Tax=Pseudomonas syringae group genomosp. 7 TaxID=251699 RepID=UPI00376FEECA